MNNIGHRLSYLIKSIIYIFLICALFFLIVMFTDSGYAPSVILATVILLVRVVKKYISVVKEEIQSSHQEKKSKLVTYDSVDGEQETYTNTYTNSQGEATSEEDENFPQPVKRDYRIGKTDESYEIKPEKDPWDL